MKVNITRELIVLRQMSVGQLLRKYREVFGEESRSKHKEFLVRRILWRIQANAEGGLSERAQRRAAELADDHQIRVRPPASFKTDETSVYAMTAVFETSAVHDNRLPPPGTLLTRNYKGKTLTVMVLEKGFEYEGQVYRTLSAVAKAATGSHWNGFNFFNLDGNGGGK